MSTQSCKDAIREFAESFGEISKDAKNFLTSLAQSPVGRAVQEIGNLIGGAALASSPRMSGITDPLQKKLLTDYLKAIGAEIFQEAIVEDTGNRLNKIFSETANATFHLFEVGPKFFYDMISRKSRELNRAIANAMASGAALAAEAVAYNAFHQTVDRSDLDNFDQNTAREARRRTIEALKEIEIAQANAKIQGNNAFLPEKVVSPQRQVTTVAGTTLTSPGANFVADGVVPGDKVTFVVVPERLSKSSSVVSTQAGFYEVVSVDSPTQLTLATPLIAEANVEYKVVRPSGAKAAVAALEAICALLTSPTAIIAFLFMEQILKRIDDFNRELNNVMRLKAEFEQSFNNTLNANILNPTRRVFNTAATVLRDTAEKFGALLAKPNFDKFTALNLLRDICGRVDVLIEAFRRNQEGVKHEISVDENQSTFNGAVVAIAAQTNGPATDWIAFSTKYRQTVQAILITDIRPQLAARTSELGTKMTAVQGWLSAQAAILVALPSVTSALTSVALNLSEASGLDKVDSLLKGVDFVQLANATSNNATKAGNAAAELKNCIEDMPVSEADKAARLSEIRTELIAFERTQVISAQAILEETPEAISEVDSQAKEVAAIQEEIEQIL